MLELLGSENKYKNFREKLFSNNWDYKMMFKNDQEYNLRPNL